MLYAKIKLSALLVAGLLLIAGLIYDNIKFRVIQMRRRYRMVEKDG
jgi:hypothetical protein